MLLSFRVENYRCFGKEVKLSMSPGELHGHPDHLMASGDRSALRLSLVLGANSSGKSNLVRAMGDSRDLVVDGRAIPEGAYNRLVPGSDSAPTGFEYIFGTEGEVYAYGFEVHLPTGGIRSEWLSVLEGDEWRHVFDRVGTGINTDIPDADTGPDCFLRTRAESIRGEPGELFLRVLVRPSHADCPVLAHARRVYGWFHRHLCVMSRERPVTDARFLPRRGMSERVLMAFDTGVTGLVPCDGGMVAYHDGEPLDYAEESDGVRMIRRLVPLLDPDGPEDATYVVDDIDLGLHPMVTGRILEEFVPVSGDTGRQLVATTHETMLLDHKLVRRDEVWFVEGRPGGSVLYSMYDFKERHPRDPRGTYLDRRYGAVPNMRSVYLRQGGDWVGD